MSANTPKKVSKNGIGKGSESRISDLKKYRQHHDEIDWKRKKPTIVASEQPSVVVTDLKF